jgi:hypothetical protein
MDHEMATDIEHPTPGEPRANTRVLEIDESGDSTPKLEARRQLRLAEKAAVTGRIGETCRFIGFGVLAIFYTLITSDKPFATAIGSNHRFSLYLAGVTGSITVFTDYLQYLCGAWSVEKTLHRTDNTYLYNTRWTSYKGRLLFYWIKQISALVASGSVVYIIVVQFIIGI